MNVKPGDLAIVVDDGGEFENLGLIVKVISFEGSFFWCEFGSQPSWQVEVVGSRGLCYWRSDKELYFKRQGKVPDCCLKRIDSDITLFDLPCDVRMPAPTCDTPIKQTLTVKEHRAVAIN